MTVFQNVSQLASWAGVCPGNNESAAKRKSGRIPKGNVYLKTALVEAAHAAAKAKGTYLRDKFYRLKARRGLKRAAVAVTHKILVAIKQRTFTAEYKQRILQEADSAAATPGGVAVIWDNGLAVIQRAIFRPTRVCSANTPILPS
jgi:Transposase IS116/IS110/IS902 family